MRSLKKDQADNLRMIDSSVIRVHQHAASIADNSLQSMGRSRGGLTTKIHALVDNNGMPVRIAISAGQDHDTRLCPSLLRDLKPGTVILADRGYDADWVRTLANEQS
jgi:IS5 family transposase